MSFNVFIEPPKPFGDHALVTADGTLHPLELSEDADYLIGSAQTEMSGFRYPIPTTARGRSPEAKTVEMFVDPRPPRTLQLRRARLQAALVTATALYRPDGLYLPLWYGELGDTMTVRGASFEAVLKPKTFDWRNPIVDDARALDAASVRRTTEFEPGVPIFSFNPASGYAVPIEPGLFRSGSMFVGVQSAVTGVYGAASLGAPVQPAGGFVTQTAGLGVTETGYTFQAPTADVVQTAEQNAVGYQADLILFCLSWQENGAFSVYSLSDMGFTRVLRTGIGAAQALRSKFAYLGTNASGRGFNGYLMPGAPAFNAPFFSHQLTSEREAREILGAWRAHLQAFAVYNPDTPDPAIAFSSLPPSLALVVGVKQTLTVTVQRFNGAPGTMTLTAEFDNVAIRHSVRAVMDTDPDSDTFVVEAWAETGIPAGAYSLSLRASAGTLSISGSVPVRVSLTAPGLPANTTHFWKLYDPVGRSLEVMAQNSAPGATSGHLVLGGTAKYSSLWDAVIGDGANLAGYGPSVVTADNVVDLATSHTVSWAFYGLDTLAVNSVLFTLASPTQKNQFYQVYKAASGLKLRTSTGTTTQVTAESGAALAVTGGEQTVSVTVDVNGVLTLLNPNVDGGSVSTPYVPLSGTGRLTLFGAKLADGTVQGLSKGVALVGAVQSVLVT